MISRKSILDWKVDYPWQLPEMVEQDLIICRAIVSIFSDPFLAKELAWKGGTALHKLYLKPQARYSEDIDLVQVNPGPIKPIFMRLGEVLSWLPNKSTQQTRYSNKIRYRYLSEVGAVPESLQSRDAKQKRDPAVDAQELVEKIDTPKTAGELRQMAREVFGKYYGDKVQSELVHNFAKYVLVLHKGANNNVQIFGREAMFK